MSDNACQHPDTRDFETDATIRTAVPHGLRCTCHAPQRRLFTRALLAGAASAAFAPAQARIDGCTISSAAKIVSADQIEGAARQQYAQLRAESSQQRALAPDNHPQMVRLRAIAQRIIPFTLDCNSRAQDWKWEVSLIGSRELNAFCMPGGKIAFYYGILKTLQLTDDEVAVVMGHEIAHALLEHARERAGKTMATRGVIEIGSALFGLGDLGRMAAGLGGQLLTLKFSRSDESEADYVGLELAARAGYDPAAGVSLWEKMLAANKGAPPQWLSTHPSGDTRIRDMEDHLPRVNPIYAAAPKPPVHYGPPKA